MLYTASRPSEEGHHGERPHRRRAPAPVRLPGAPGRRRARERRHPRVRQPRAGRPLGAPVARPPAAALVRRPHPQRCDDRRHRPRRAHRHRTAPAARRPRRDRAGAHRPGPGAGRRPGAAARRGRRRRPQLQPLRHRDVLHPPGRPGRLRRDPDHQREPRHGTVGRPGEGARHQPVVDRRTRPGRSRRRRRHRQHRRGAGQDLPGQEPGRAHPRHLGPDIRRRAHDRSGRGRARGGPADGRPQGLCDHAS